MPWNRENAPCLKKGSESLDRNTTDKTAGLTCPAVKSVWNLKPVDVHGMPYRRSWRELTWRPPRGRGSRKQVRTVARTFRCCPLRRKKAGSQGGQGSQVTHVF